MNVRARKKIQDRKKKKKKKGVLILHLKKHVFSTSILETSWWLVLYDWFPTKFVFTYNTSLVWWNKRRSKVQEKNMSCEHTLNFDQWKTINQWEFDYGLFTNLPRIIVARCFSPSSFKLRRGILPPLTKYVSQLENYSSYQAELLENLLLAKYLISVSAPLKYKLINNYCWSQNQNIKR